MLNSLNHFCLKQLSMNKAANKRAKIVLFDEAEKINCVFFPLVIEKDILARRDVIEHHAVRKSHPHNRSSLWKTVCSYRSEHTIIEPY